MDTSPGIFVNVNLTDYLLFNFIMAFLRKKNGFSKKKIEVDKNRIAIYLNMIQ